MAKQTGGAGRRPRRWRWILPTALALALLATALFFVNRKQLLTPAQECHVATDAGESVLGTDQAANAAVIAAVARSRNLPERAVTIALATALQESHLKNLGGGDRDSIGLFQQRPSQGWGTARQISDPVYATNKFLDGLLKVPGYSRLPLTEAAQAVQKSGYPQAYAKQETEATVLTGALSGRAPASLACTVDEAAPVAAASATTGADGLTEGARAIAAQVRRDFDQTVTVERQPADSGRTLRLVAARSSGDAGSARQARWAVAHWAVARAAQLGIGSVVCEGMRWQMGADGAWHAYRGPSTGGRVLVTAAR